MRITGIAVSLPRLSSAWLWSAVAGVMTTAAGESQVQGAAACPCRRSPNNRTEIDAVWEDSREQQRVHALPLGEGQEEQE